MYVYITSLKEWNFYDISTFFIVFVFIDKTWWRYKRSYSFKKIKKTFPMIMEPDDGKVYWGRSKETINSKFKRRGNTGYLYVPGLQQAVDCYRRRCLPSDLCANIENKYEDKFVSNFLNSFGYTTYRLGENEIIWIVF